MADEIFARKPRLAIVMVMLLALLTPAVAAQAPQLKVDICLIKPQPQELSKWIGQTVNLEWQAKFACPTEVVAIKIDDIRYDRFRGEYFNNEQKLPYSFDFQENRFAFTLPRVKVVAGLQMSLDLYCQHKPGGPIKVYSGKLSFPRSQYEIALKKLKTLQQQSQKQITAIAQKLEKLQQEVNLLDTQGQQLTKALEKLPQQLEPQCKSRLAALKQQLTEKLQNEWKGNLKEFAQLQQKKWQQETKKLAKKLQELKIAAIHKDIQSLQTQLADLSKTLENKDKQWQTQLQTLAGQSQARDKQLQALAGQSQARDKQWQTQLQELAAQWQTRLKTLAAQWQTRVNALEQDSLRQKNAEQTMQRQKIIDLATRLTQSQAQLKLLHKLIKVPIGFRYLRRKTYSCGGKKHSVDEYQHQQTGMEFVLIPGASFLMGSNAGSKDEQPVRRVQINSFLLSKTEVTQEVWAKIMGNNPSYFRGKNRPVENISWEDCKRFCQQTNLRMPTEAEWEYAARAGAQTKYYWGDYMDRNCAWYIGNSEKRTHPVAQKPPNAFGLHDMSGNVWEWCQDWYGQEYYRQGENSNPQGPITGSAHVLRGGSYSSDAVCCRSAYRLYYYPGFNGHYLGLRLAARCRGEEISASHSFSRR